MSIDFRVNGCYSLSDLEKSLSICKFMPHYSFWNSNTGDLYSFHHLPLKYLKIKYQLEHIIHREAKIDAGYRRDDFNCCSPTRMGL